MALPLSDRCPSFFLLCELLEFWANNGELDPFHAAMSVETNYDGLDDATQDALDWMRFDYGEDDDVYGVPC